MADIDVNVRVFPQQLARLLNSPNGPVMRSLFRDGERVKQEAKREVGVWAPPPGAPGWVSANRARRPGTLRDSIVKRFVNTSRGLAVQVIAEDEIALWHHEGTRAHTIRARSKPLLVFFTGGRTVRTVQVSHPGTAPNRFLTKAVAKVFRGRR